MSESNLIEERKGPVAVITVNRPKVLNALNRQTLSELREAFTGLSADREVQVILLTGAGEKAFIAGADIRELADLSPLEARAFAREGQQVCDLISNCSKPVIAAINGFALGGGCEVSMACHMRIASKNAKLGQPEVNLGVIPGWGGTQRLARLVGLGRAVELILTGDTIPAEEAYRIGLVNRVVDQDALLPTCEEIAGKIAGKGPLAVRLGLEAARRGLEGTLNAGLAIEADAFGLCASTSDWREGTAAFLEKRKPSFKGA
jgi:enoyl-CoA hydratase